jgi:uncharacterized iron-regulated protein
MRSLLFTLGMTLFSFSLFAETVFNSPIYSVKQGKFISFKQLSEQLAIKDLVVIGELHDRVTHHQNQRLILESLENRVRFNVGLEFVSWDKQSLFNDYQEGRLPLIDFISQVWGEGNFSFDWYKPLVEAAGRSGGWAYGINAPKKLASRIGRGGLDSLSEQERSMLPPNFTLGSDLYMERFIEAMGGHAPPNVDNYFAAQSLWDESMAYQSLIHRDQDLFVIIVGQFHIEYKLGLPARLKARNPNLDFATVIQLETKGQNPADVIRLLQADEKYGELGDYILLTN